MKYAIIGDIHGTELDNLEMALNVENPDVLICTGDFDQVKTIHQFMKLEKTYQKSRKRVIKVPGNHDHAILSNLGISSGTLRSQGMSSYELYHELMKDPVAHRFIDKLVNSSNRRYTNNRVRIFLDEDKFDKAYRTIIVHGAYDGDLSSYPNCPENIRDLWIRLRTEDDYEKNFKIMSKKGYDLMIRGHDHDPAYVYKDPVKGIVKHTPKNSESSYRLLKHRRHTINPGALFEGFFATIDSKVIEEEVPILKYHKL